MLTEGMCLEHNSEREDIDIFYTESSGQAPQNIRCLDVLHMGKWKKSSSQHIEFVDDSELFFKEIQILSGLKYISFRGVSMLQELPKFITKLTRLEFLDLQACYNLEKIPSDISNLKDSLTHLDMSECYFLEHMPKALATLYNLEVLKGFFVGDVIDETTCTLEDLFQLQSLVKLSIYTRVKEFPNRSQLRALQKFGKLVSLTISWGGCKSSPRDEYRESKSSSTGFEEFSFNLKKLDLQCVPQIDIPRWLLPKNFRNLKRLYIRGGKLHSLGQASSEEGSRWNVQILRLKHMSKLSLSWEDLGRLFPALFSLEMVNCPNLGGFPCGDDGVWIKN